MRIQISSFCLPFVFELANMYFMGFFSVNKLKTPTKSGNCGKFQSFKKFAQTRIFCTTVTFTALSHLMHRELAWSRRRVTGT